MQIYALDICLKPSKKFIKFFSVGCQQVRVPTKLTYLIDIENVLYYQRSNPRQTQKEKHLVS